MKQSTTYMQNHKYLYAIGSIAGVIVLIAGVILGIFLVNGSNRINGLLRDTRQDTHILGTVTPNPNAPPGNFLWSSQTEAMFLAWVDDSGSLSGQTQDARIVTDQSNQSFQDVTSTQGSFHGTLTSSQVSLDFGGFLGYSSIITGTYDGTTLNLNMPTTTGDVDKFTFVPATTNDFNNAKSALQATVDSSNSSLSSSFAQATQVASEQQAVSDANSQLGNALSRLGSDASTLSSFSISSTLDSYAGDWKSMQNDYATEQKDAQAGCGDGSNYGTVQSDAGTVDSDDGSIQSDDGSLSSDKGTYDSDLSAVQSDIQSVNSAWSSLQQAVANNTTGTPAPQYTAKDISDALSSAQSAEKTAKGVWQAAQASATQYDQEANALKQKADALPSSMHC